MRGMRIGRWRFAPPVWASVLALAVSATALSLGNWQTGRAQGRQAQQARLDALSSAPALRVGASLRPAAELVNHRITARGRLLDEHGWLVDNRIHHGRAGYHVVTPLLLDDPAAAPGAGPVVVLVNRGWIAASARREELPLVPAPKGVVEIEGTGVEAPARAYELATEAPAGRVRQNLLLDRALAELSRSLPGVVLQPVVLQQTGGGPGTTGDGLARDWPRADARADVNRAYALQWYALALLAVVIWVAMNLKRET